MEQQIHKTPGQLAYEEDVRRKPLHHDGTHRPRWDQLDEVCKWSWDRKPIPREWPSQAKLHTAPRNIDNGIEI